MRSHIAIIFIVWSALVGRASGQENPKGTLKGVVVDDIRAQPVVGATVRLTGGGLESPLDSRTDSAGLFTFGDLPPARYTLTVERSGYFPRAPSAPEDGGGVLVDIGPSEAKISITLSKIRTIEGTVKWQDGEPATEGVIVHVLKLRRGEARLKLGDAFVTPVKQDGHYKIENIRPGHYVVYAYHLALGNSDRPRVALPVFYPDSPVPEAAVSVDLISSASASSLDLKLRDVGGVSVEGTVIASPDFPAGTPLRLSLNLAGSPAQAIAATKTQSGSSFRILDVPPGSYQLLAVPGAQFKDMRTVQPLQVPTNGVKEVRVVMSRSVPISGHAQVERTVPSSATPAKVSSHIEPAPGVDFDGMPSDLQLGAIMRRTNKDGDVHLDGSLDGLTYLTNIQAPAGMYVTKVTQDGRELNGGPFALRGGGGLVEVLLRDDGGKIDGTIKNKDGAPSSGFVVLAPRQRNKEHLFRTSTVADNGLFQLQDVAPGDYELFALDRNDSDMYFVSRYLDQFRRNAVTVSITPSANMHFALDVTATAQAAR